MRIAWIGLGKLGAPCALALNVHGGHEVHGYDTDSRVAAYLQRQEPYPHREEGIQELLDANTIRMHSTLDAAVEQADVVFLAVQTPHAAEYGGETPVPDTTADFEYGYLIDAVRGVVRAVSDRPGVTLVVISTVLPGTMNRVVKPLLPPNITLVYNPFFIAMGTTVADYMRPEFVLIGVDEPGPVAVLREIYGKLHDEPLHVVSIESAELTKVAYNTFISMKIVFANTIMEICDKTGADCDQVIDGLTLATDRVISPAYLRGGMGDGGGCHPRDNIAMSHLAQRLDLSFDLMGTVSRARDAQARYLADLAARWAALTRLPVAVVGRAYKPGTDLTMGSPAVLLHHLLLAEHPAVKVAANNDVHVDGISPSGTAPHVFVVGTKHEEHGTVRWPAGSVVIDPFGYLEPQPDITYIPVGRKI